jgi:hypothetical protein
MVIIIIIIVIVTIYDYQHSLSYHIKIIITELVSLKAAA